MRKQNKNFILVVFLGMVVTGLVVLRAWALSAPTGLTASVSNGAVTLQWNQVPASTAYYIYRTLLLPTGTWTATPTPTASGTPTLPVPVATVPETGAPGYGYTDFQVTNGQNYLYQVGAFDPSGVGPLAPVTAVPYSAPGLVQPFTQNLHANAIDLFWAVPFSSFPVTYYVVSAAIYPFTPTPTGTLPPPTTPGPNLQATAAIGAVVPIATVFGTSYSDTTPFVTPGTSVAYYAIQAVQMVGNTPVAGPLPVAALGPLSPNSALPPAHPTLSAFFLATLTPTPSPSSYGVQLSWNGPLASEGVTAYQVLSNSTTLATVTVATPSPIYTFVDQTIPFSGVPVTYQVQVENIYSATPIVSNPIPVSLFPSSLSGSVQASPNSVVDGIQGVTVVWNTGTSGTYGLSGYKVYKSLFGPPTVLVPQFGTPTPTSILTATWTPTPFAIVPINASPTQTLVAIDAGVTNANGWSYWVQPYDGLGLVGSPALMPTPGSFLLAPTPVGAVQATPIPGTNNEINVNWQPLAVNSFYGTVQDYVIYRELTTAQTPTPVATVPAAQVSYNDFVVGTPGTPQVFYQVAAVDPIGNTSTISSPSNAVSFSALVTPVAPQVLPVAGGPGTLQLGWVANPASDNVDSYYVYDSNYLTQVATATQTPLAVITATPVPTYSTPVSIWNSFFGYVEAHNAQGFSSPSTLSGFAVPTYQVTAAMTPGSQQVQVSWNLTPALGNSTPGADSYGVYRSLSTGAGFTPIATVVLPTTGYTDSAVGPGTTYYYRVTLRGGGGVGQLAESPLYPNLTPMPEGSTNTWPNVPVGFTASGGANQTTLSWFGNASKESVLSYAVTQLQNGVPVSVLIQTATATVSPTPTSTVYNSISFPETIAGGMSSYVISAQNTQGNSVPVTVNVLVPPTVMPTVGVTPPTWVIPTPGVTPAFTQLVWISGLSYPGVVGGYTIYRGGIPTPSITITPTFIPVENVAYSTPFVVDPGVPGYVNYYQVQANNGAGLAVNPAAVPVQAVTLWPNPPNVNIASSGTAVTLSWATPVGNNTSINSFTIYRSQYPGVTPTVIATVPTPGSSFTDSGVTAGQGYTYWVDAEGPGGTSAFPVGQGIIPLQPPTLALTPLSSKNILNWSPVTVAAPNMVTGYVVYRAFLPTPSMTPSFNQISSTLQGYSNTTYIDQGLADTSTYIYKVAAVPLNIPGFRSDYSNAVTQTVLPQPVSTLLAVSGDGEVQLRWNNEGVTTITYTLQRKLGTAPDSSYQTLKTGLTGANYLDVGVQDKTFYAYQLITVDVPSPGITYISPPSAPAIALPAKPPFLTNSALNLIQDNSSGQTLIGNGLSWVGADVPGAGMTFDPTTMYPLGGYNIFSSTDGGGIYQLINQLPANYSNGIPASPVNYFDAQNLVGGKTYTYLVQAFDAPPDLPVPLSQAATQGLAHTTSYNTVTAYPISPNTALDRNAIRPFGQPNEQKVNIRFVVQGQGNVNIKVFTLSGTFVKELVNGAYSSGIYWTAWDARNMNGTLVASGVYLVSTESPGGHQEFQKVAVIK